MKLIEGGEHAVSEFVTENKVIREHHFRSTLLYGPAVIYLNDCRITLPISTVDDPETLFWTLPGERGYLPAGVIYCDSCVFESVTFRNVGITVSLDQRSVFEERFGWTFGG